MPGAWQEYWTFRIVDQDSGAAVAGVPVTVRDEPGVKGGHWVSDADGLVRIPKHSSHRLRLRVGLRADDTIELDARSLPDDIIPLAAPPRGDTADGPTPAQPTAAFGRDIKAGHLTRFARIGVLPADSDVMSPHPLSPSAETGEGERAGRGPGAPPLRPAERGTGGEVKGQGVRYGVLFEVEQYWQSQGFTAGDVLYSLSLGPGDEAQVAVLDGRWRRKPDSRERPIQIVAKMIAAPTVGDGLEAVPLEAFVIQDLGPAVTDTGRYVAQRTQRAADALRRRPLGVAELEGTLPPGGALRTVRNMRSDGVLTYHFVEPVERFRVVTRTPRLRGAILVPFKLPVIATRDVVRRFGHAMRRALLDRSLLPDLDNMLGPDGAAGVDGEARIYAHIASHLSYYSATIIAAGDPVERGSALAKLKDGEGRPLMDVIENVVVGRVGSYVAFPLRDNRFAPPEWREALSSNLARLLRASDESTVILPVRGVWLRVQLSAAVPEGEIGMGEGQSDAQDESRGSRRRRG